MSKIKQIVLQLDEKRYQVLVEALTNLSKETGGMVLAYPDEERVIAEQLKGLVTTQWTGSRDEEVKSNIMPIHAFVKDPFFSFCARCHQPEGWPIHNVEKEAVVPEVSQKQLEAIAIKFDEVSAGERKVNYHKFEPSTNLDGTPNYKRCKICHKGQKSKVHSLDD